MSRSPMIPAQPVHASPAAHFHALASRLLAVPKSEIDKQEKRYAAKAKQPKKS